MVVNRKYKKMYTESSSVLNTDTFDRDRFLQLTTISSSLGELTDKKVREDVSSLPLMGDLWASLYKTQPALKEIPEGESISHNHPLVERVLEDETYQRMRQTTRLDDLSSALGTMRMTEVITEWIQSVKNENEKLREQMEDLNRKKKELQSEQEKKQTKKQQEKTDALQEQIEQIQNSVSQELRESLNQSGDSFSEKLAQAEKETKEGKEDLKSLFGGGAGDGEAELKKIPLKDQIQLSEILRANKKVKEIAEWAGRFKAIARKKQKSKHVESLDRSGMTYGDDVERLLPQELALLLKDNTRSDFLRRFAEGQTMMYSPKGKETLGKGPIVVCMDQSGSMADLDPQSKGFVLALAMIAKKQRRDFAVISFSSRVGKTYLYEKGKISPKQFVELATDFAGGGTQYSPVLEEALNLIEKYKRFNHADLIFVTDGEPSDVGVLKRESWLNDFLDRKKQKQVQLMSLLIGKSINEKWVKPFSDQVIHADDFNKDEVSELFTI